MSTLKAAGLVPRPGIVCIVPHSATSQPAPVYARTSRTVSSNPVGAFVSSDAGFTEQPRVANGASEFLLELFGDAGKHARAAVGVNTLPLDAAVEVDFIFELA